MLSERTTPSVISAATGSGVGSSVAVGSGVGVGSGVAVGAAVGAGVSDGVGSGCAGAPQAARSAQSSADIRRREIRFFVAGVLSPAAGAGWVWGYYRSKRRDASRHGFQRLPCTKTSDKKSIREK